jgi:hypothetical protein
MSAEFTIQVNGQIYDGTAEGISYIKASFACHDFDDNFLGNTDLYATGNWPSSYDGFYGCLKEVVIQLDDKYELYNPIGLTLFGNIFNDKDYLINMCTNYQEDVDNGYYAYYFSDEEALWPSRVSGIDGFVGLVLTIDAHIPSFYVNTETDLNVNIDISGVNEPYNGYIYKNSQYDITVTPKSGYFLNNVDISGCIVIETYTRSDSEVKLRIQVDNQDIMINADTSTEIAPLSIIASPGTTITVERVESQTGATLGYLNDGDILYNGDLLHVVVDVEDGYYAITTITNYAPSSYVYSEHVGSIEKDVGVWGGVTVHSDTTVREGALSIITSPDTTITIERVASPTGATLGYLNDGDILYGGDKLYIDVDVEDGYHPIIKVAVDGQPEEILSSHEYNVSPFLTGNVVIQTVVIGLTGFYLTIDAGDNSVIEVKRTKSNIIGALCGPLNHGDVVYYEDELKISYKASPGYALNGCKVSHQFAQETYNTYGYNTYDESFSFHFINSDGDTVQNEDFTNRNLIISSDESTLKQFKFKKFQFIRKSYGLDYVDMYIMLERINSPLAGAPLGVIDEGEAIYSFDVLKLIVDKINLVGYSSDCLNVNYASILIERTDLDYVEDLIGFHTEEPFVFDEKDLYSNGSEIEILNGAAFIQMLDGFIPIDNGTELDKYCICIDNGTRWGVYTMYIDNGKEWVPCGYDYLQPEEMQTLFDSIIK